MGKFCPRCSRRPAVGRVSGGSVFVSNRVVVFDDNGSCDVPSPLDLDLLAEVIEAFEDELSSSDVVVTPAQKAETIVDLYELALEDAAGADCLPDAADPKGDA